MSGRFTFSILSIIFFFQSQSGKVGKLIVLPNAAAVQFIEKAAGYLASVQILLHAPGAAVSMICRMVQAPCVGAGT